MAAQVIDLFDNRQRRYCVLGYRLALEHNLAVKASVVRLYPSVTLDCITYEPLLPAYDAGDFLPVRNTLAISADRLARAWAEFFVCPDNTCHPALELEAGELALPGLHTVQEVASAAANAGYHRVGILGTRFTMTGPLYPRELAARGIEAVIPEQTDLEMVDHVTLSELVYGKFAADSRSRFVAVIARLNARGASAVALACSEHPLPVTPEASPFAIARLDPFRHPRRRRCRARTAPVSNLARRPVVFIMTSTHSAPYGDAQWASGLPNCYALFGSAFAPAIVSRAVTLVYESHSLAR